jgi:hypothetical protein
LLNKMTSAAAAAIDARTRSGHSVRAIPATACATMATATSFKPWMRPIPIGPLNAAAPFAKTTRAIADGKVKPIQAASAPG